MGSGPDPLSDLRRSLIGRGLDPEAVNDMVMLMGHDNFRLHTTAVIQATERAERRLSDQFATRGGLFEYELLLRLLGVDSTTPSALMEAVGRIHHLVDHSVEGGCQLAAEVVRRDPFRMQAP